MYSAAVACGHTLNYHIHLVVAEPAQTQLYHTVLSAAGNLLGKLCHWLLAQATGEPQHLAEPQPHYAYCKYTVGCLAQKMPSCEDHADTADHTIQH